MEYQEIAIIITLTTVIIGLLKFSGLFKDVHDLRYDFDRHKDSIRDNYPTTPEVERVLNLKVEPLITKMNEMHVDIKEISRRELERLEREKDK